MPKLINDPHDFVDEVIEGILLAHGDRLRAASDDARAIVRTRSTPGTVGIVTGGGSGHLPLFLGYVGVGLCSAVAVGNVFSSPSAAQIADATRAADEGAGVLYLYGNYGGDVYNFDLAADLVEPDGIRTRTVLGADDVASAPVDRARSRRGVAGIFFAYKIAGAAAARGDDLDAVAEIAQRAVDRTGTMGVGLSPTVLPTTGKPSFELAEGQMEVGIGIHGEPGSRTGALSRADEVTDELLDRIVADRGIARGTRVAVLVNGMGATPLEELYVLSRRSRHRLDAIGAQVHRTYVGEFATSLEMGGASISLLVLDDELAALLDAPADSPFFTQTGVAPDRGASVAPTGSGVAASRAETVMRGRDGELSASRSTEPAAPTADANTRAAAAALVRGIRGVMPLWARHADELRDLDAALGDGDLGITVSSGAAAIEQALDGVTADDPAQPLLAAGEAFATANPSTFAALAGGGMLAAASAVRGATTLDREALHAALTALADRIAQRGGAQPGDKTVLDALLPSIAALRSTPADAATDEALAAMRVAAWAGVRETAGLVSQRGRASWVGERSAGRADPGATAYARLLDAVAEWREGVA